MTDIHEDRLIALECRLAHYERMAEEISDVMISQGRMIDVMTVEIRRLRARLGEIEAGGSSRMPQDEPPPPHY
ncbi:SlyX family protein [Magnetospirillum molischianum]|uniref:Protein slyX homolog n=1 Tax=Magnetospirillum molischianum DSM 120 TaxID=1150626 RepID=H8FWW9_MAGML|nr:SlyX family protein [Magnetospirillum molischianum]CCG42857.1 Protein slyX homolog [Magnetospirillum molischianum DSM 120]